MKYKCPKCGNEIERFEGATIFCTCNAGANCTVMVPIISATEIVERFNELVKEGKIEYRTDDCDRFGELYGKCVYRLRPTPRYRPFTAVEALAHLGCRVKSKKHGYETFFSGFGVDYHESKKINLHFGDPHKGVSTRTPEQAFEDYEFLTGEPFGVKVTE